MSELRVKADTEELDNVFSFVHDLIQNETCSARVMLQLDVAIEELFVNIAHYAYQENTGDVTVIGDYNKEDATITITFVDSGMPYNPLEKEDPDITLSVEERQIGGLGIYMVKKTMDAMEYCYENGENRLTIKKKIR